MQSGRSIQVEAAVSPRFTRPARPKPVPAATPPDERDALLANYKSGMELAQLLQVRAEKERDAALAALAAAPRPALSPDALLVQKILEDAANLLDDYWLHDAKGNLIATKGNLRAAILGLKSKYLRAPAPREGSPRSHRTRRPVAATIKERDDDAASVRGSQPL